MSMSTLPTVRAFAGTAEAALALGHRTYSGTVATTQRSAPTTAHHTATPASALPVAGYTSVSAAALALGHRTYSGTVSTTQRRP